MKGMLKQVFGWHAGPPAWGPAVIAGLGCALPLVLGLFSGHPGFLWASVGAFLAAQSNPLHRFGMLRLLLLTLFGACSAGLGFWAASDAVLSLVLFAAYGFLLAWLQRFGTEAGKLGLGLIVCLCLGQGQFGISGLHNPDAVAALFILGGLWVALLAFGLRGLHGLRMWPYMPRFLAILKVLKRHAQRLPRQQWRLHALACMLAFGCASKSGSQDTGINSPHAERFRRSYEAAFDSNQQESSQQLLRKARSAIGTPYVRGGTTPDGFDCSGFVCWTYKSVGVQLPRTAREQSVIGQRINNVDEIWSTAAA